MVCHSPCSQSAAHMHNSKLRLHKQLRLLLPPVVPCSPSACRILLLPLPADLLPLQGSQVSLKHLLCSASQETLRRVLCGCIKQSLWFPQGILPTLTARPHKHKQLCSSSLTCFLCMTASGKTHKKADIHCIMCPLMCHFNMTIS